MTKLSLLNLSYLIANRPLKSIQANRNELFNESCILITFYIMIIFMNSAIDVDSRGFLGWILIGVAGFNIFYNLSLTAFESI